MVTTVIKNKYLEEQSKAADEVIDEYNIHKIENSYGVSFEKIEDDNIVEKILCGIDSVLFKFKYGQMLTLKNDIIQRITGGSISILTMYTYEELLLIRREYEKNNSN